MQNRYVGDLGDFGRYGLLRALRSSNGTDDGSALSLGVVWYLTPDEAHNNDGMHIGYLEPSHPERERYRECDPRLYDALGDIVRAGARDVSNIPQRRILPSDTKYYEAPLTFDGIIGRERRIAHRKQWLGDALDLTRQCDVVFLDPDTGMGIPSVKAHHEEGPKYAFFDELSRYLERGQSLIVYQHRNREPASQQIQSRLVEIKKRLGHRAFALRYRPGSGRVFFVVPAQRHRDLLYSRAERLESRWKGDFELVGTA